MDFLSAPPADTALFPLQIVLNALLDLFRQLDGIITISCAACLNPSLATISLPISRRVLIRELCRSDKLFSLYSPPR
jgi:hypothetical protein